MTETLSADEIQRYKGYFLDRKEVPEEYRESMKKALNTIAQRDEQIAAMKEAGEEFHHVVWTYSSGHYVNGKPALKDQMVAFETAFENTQAAAKAHNAKQQAIGREQGIREAAELAYALTKEEDNFRMRDCILCLLTQETAQ